MKKIRVSMAVIAGLMTLFCFPKAWSGQIVEPDNSSNNARDRSGRTLTPRDQSRNPEDVRITRGIRKSLMKDKSLSFTAKNIKIITANGVVTVRGPVNSQAEKNTIDTCVRRFVDDKKFSNQLEVKSK